jgi:hypothetical protein
MKNWLNIISATVLWLTIAIILLRYTKKIQNYGIDYYKNKSTSLLAKHYLNYIQSEAFYYGTKLAGVLALLVTILLIFGMFFGSFQPR